MTTIPDTRTAGAVARVAAGAGGVLVIVGGAVISFGTVVLAPIGMGIAALVQSRRRRSFGLVGSWMVCVLTVAVALAIAAGVLLSRMPAGTWQHMQQAADSASALAAQRPPPSWLRRVAPGAVQPATLPPTASRAFTTLTFIWGGAIVLIFMSALYGTIGWGAGLLLGFAFRGRWVGTRAGDGTPAPDINSAAYTG